MHGATYILTVGPLHYYGSSRRPDRRKREHLWRLRKNSHRTQELQDAFNQGHTPTFTILKEFPKKPNESLKDYSQRLKFHEHQLLQKHFDDTGNTNQSRSAFHPHSAGKHLKALWQNPEYRQKMTNLAKGRKPSPKARQRMAKAKTGKNNPKAKPCTIHTKDHKTLHFDTATQAAKHFNTSQQSMHNWLAGITPWPGSGQRLKANYAHLAGTHGHYD